MRLAAITIASAALIALGLGGPAQAQSAPGAPGTDQVIPEKVRPESAPATDAGKGANLSEKLNASGGVIKPKGDVDPAMDKAAPDAGSMPVIKPPGGPGGDPGVQPK